MCHEEPGANRQKLPRFRVFGPFVFFAIKTMPIPGEDLVYVGNSPRHLHSRKRSGRFFIFSNPSGERSLFFLCFQQHFVSPSYGGSQVFFTFVESRFEDVCGIFIIVIHYNLFIIIIIMED